MKVCSVIGTRPQYIKIAPFAEAVREHGHEHIIVDTNQHFSECMSTAFVSEFNLQVHSLNCPNTNELEFLGESIKRIGNYLADEKPDRVVVVGDTNSTVAAAMVSRKLGIRLAHLEAGIRCGDLRRPEELNRIVVDDLADVHFISRQQDATLVRNPVLLGDMEYVLLNRRTFEILREPWLLMTIHRQENMNHDRLNAIASFCFAMQLPIRFLLHHRTAKAIKDFAVIFPANVECLTPTNYADTLELIRCCKGLITDSGGLCKIAPYFGKRSIVPFGPVEWTDTIELGYTTTKLDQHWFDALVPRNTLLYYNENWKEGLAAL